MITTLDIVANKKKSLLLSEAFQAKLGTIIEDYRVEGILPKCFTFIFLLRRFCYSTVLIVLVSYPHSQLGICITFLILPVNCSISYIYIYIYRWHYGS